MKTPLPPFLYGTAWKEDATQRLTELALQQGFRGIDTANQLLHYDEAAVGRAVQASIASGHVNREDLFLQTKFTFRGAQDHRLPYHPDAPIPAQVEQSFASSLEHLGIEQMDAYLLHGPATSDGLTEADWAAWGAMESIHDSGRVKALGVSNVTLVQLESFRQARIPPVFVQNRCFAASGWDRGVREFCQAHDLIYQGFSLLTANRQALATAEMSRIAHRHGRSIPQIVFRFALQVGMIPLTGTTSIDHMQDDLGVLDFQLEAEEVEQIDTLPLTAP